MVNIAHFRSFTSEVVFDEFQFLFGRLGNARLCHFRLQARRYVGIGFSLTKPPRGESFHQRGKAKLKVKGSSVHPVKAVTRFANTCKHGQNCTDAGISAGYSGSSLLTGVLGYGTLCSTGIL